MGQRQREQEPQEQDERGMPTFLRVKAMAGLPGELVNTRGPPVEMAGNCHSHRPRQKGWTLPYTVVCSNFSF